MSEIEAWGQRIELKFKLAQRVVDADVYDNPPTSSTVRTEGNKEFESKQPQRNYDSPAFNELRKIESEFVKAMKRLDKKLEKLIREAGK